MAIRTWFSVTGWAKMSTIAIVALWAIMPAAYAGFEWTPPPVAQQQTAPSVMASPIPEVHMEDSGPLLPDRNSELMIMDKVEITDLPFKKAPMPLQKEQEVFAMTNHSYDRNSQKEAFETAVGFGKDIPLVLAMRQIVPASYSYSFDTGVNPGVRVSWQGGRPWDVVINAALAPLNLHAVISGKAIQIQHGFPAAEQEILKQDVNVLSVQETVPLYSPPVMMSAPVTGPEKRETVIQSYPKRVRPEITQKFEMTPHVPSARVFQSKKDVENDDIPYAPTPLTPSPFADGSDQNSIVLPPVPATTAAATEILMAPSAGKFSVMDPFEIKFWHAEKGASLKTVLEEWGSQAGVAIVWNPANDYQLPTSIRMHGTFSDAITSVLINYNELDPRPLGQLHPNLPAGPSVLVIENYSKTTNS
ncbi:MAG: hypothetical protein CO093_10370 [Alphaproteobacteria bacterium CG_4_9_14_3_um_filter_47_13]|nr:MAG: hypothetical protein CO093_10370 [Alphaproteobacteria bacterium CG_4_9_14_3_um_filter_47_13]